jgi:hypothetical protein
MFTTRFDDVVRRDMNHRREDAEYVTSVIHL